MEKSKQKRRKGKKRVETPPSPEFGHECSTTTTSPALAVQDKVLQGLRNSTSVLPY